MATINIVFFITTDFLGDSGKEYHNGKKTRAQVQVWNY